MAYSYYQTIGCIQMTIDLTSALSRPDAAGVSGQWFQPRLIPRLRVALRFRRDSLKAEKAYVQWVRRYIYFHGKRHPQDMGAVEVTAFLNHLANAGQVAAAALNRALAASMPRTEWPLWRTFAERCFAV